MIWVLRCIQICKRGVKTLDCRTGGLSRSNYCSPTSSNHYCRTHYSHTHALYTALLTLRVDACRRLLGWTAPQLWQPPCPAHCLQQKAPCERSVLPLVRPWTAKRCRFVAAPLRLELDQIFKGARIWQASFCRVR